MKKFKLSLLSHLAFMLIFGATAMAQTSEQSQLYVVIGGALSNSNIFVEISLHDPQILTDTPFGTIYSHAVQKALIHDDVLFITALNSLAAYDLTTESRPFRSLNHDFRMGKRALSDSVKISK